MRAWRNSANAMRLKRIVPRGLAGSIPAARTSNFPRARWIFRESDPSARALDDARRTYSFLLGIYLGDGHIVAAKKSYRLQIYLHRANQPLIDRVVVAIKTFLPERSVAVIRHGAANRSEDILGAETISIARRAEVKRLDRLFGFGDKLEN